MAWSGRREVLAVIVRHGSDRAVLAWVECYAGFFSGEFVYMHVRSGPSILFRVFSALDNALPVHNNHAKSCGHSIRKPDC